MITSLRRMFAVSIVVSSEVHFRQARGSGQGDMTVHDIGWVIDSEGALSHVHTERTGESPESFWLTFGGAPAADTGDGSVQVVPVRPKHGMHGGGTFVLSQMALPHAGAVDQLGLHREWGDRPFSGREHRLVRLFHVELGRLWRRDVLRRAKEPSTDLPPRLAQTLEQLLAGASEKQIAAKLELSPHTVHNYVKALHQRFEVNSRGELLAKAGQARSESAPKFSMAPPLSPPRPAARAER